MGPHTLCPSGDWQLRGHYRSYDMVLQLHDRWTQNERVKKKSFTVPLSCIFVSCMKAVTCTVWAWEELKPLSFCHQTRQVHSHTWLVLTVISISDLMWNASLLTCLKEYINVKHISFPVSSKCRYDYGWILAYRCVQSMTLSKHGTFGADWTVHMWVTTTSIFAMPPRARHSTKPEKLHNLTPQGSSDITTQSQGSLWNSHKM